MKKAIVTTTINPPTEALKKFAEIATKDGWDLIIVGDLKTPHDDYKEFCAQYECATYMNPADQTAISPKLSQLIGWNCIQRRNFGLIKAYQDGAEIIATVDDDNIPYPGWGQHCKVNREIDLKLYKTDEPVFDPISPFLGQIWHRGFPVQDLDSRKLKEGGMVKRKVLVQADFWDGAPDVDAICRITLNPIVKFPATMIPITSNAIMPFNSQNTFLSSDILPVYFLFPHVGRMDDIWASFVTQFAFPNSVAFCKASVNQIRNEHDLTKDLEAELLGYRHNHDFVRSPKDWQKFLPAEALEAYDVYKQLITVTPTRKENPDEEKNA